MSNHITSKIWKLEGIPATIKFVLIKLGDNASDEGVCWPSVQNMAKECELSDRTVQAAIKWGEKHGIITCKPRKGHSTVYDVTPENYVPPKSTTPEICADTPENHAPPPPKSTTAPPKSTTSAYIEEPSLENLQLNHQGTEGGPPASAVAPRATTPAKQIFFLGEENERDIPDRAQVRLAENFDLPTKWGEYAENLGFNASEILAEAEKFKAYWTVGKGAGGRKSKRSWRQSWSNWLDNSAKYNRVGGRRGVQENRQNY